MGVFLFEGAFFSSCFWYGNVGVSKLKKETPMFLVSSPHLGVDIPHASLRALLDGYPDGGDGGGTCPKTSGDEGSEPHKVGAGFVWLSTNTQRIQ